MNTYLVLDSEQKLLRALVTADGWCGVVLMGGVLVFDGISICENQAESCSKYRMLDGKSG